MRPPVAAIIDVDALAQVVLVSFLAGIALTLLFSIVIFSATRASDLRRSGSVLAATLLVVVAVVGVLACAALVAVGIYIMASR